MSLNLKIQNKNSNQKFFSPYINNNNNNYNLENCQMNNSLLGNNNLKIIELCTKKLSKKPNNKRALLLRASIYIKMNKFEEAKNDLEPLLDDNILASTAYYLFGIINKETNNNELALKYFTKSIELDNNNINAYFLRGAINNILGNYKDAIKDYNDAIYKDTLKTEGKNVYKNISKIFAQALGEEKKISKKEHRRNSLINNERNNFMLNRFQISYNQEKYKKKCKCCSEENNLKMKNYTNNNNNNNNLNSDIEEKINNSSNIKNIVVNSTLNNFNFFIRNIALKKMNEKYSDTYNLLKEIDGYLNEEDTEEKLSINLQFFNKNDENIKNRNNIKFHNSITTNNYERISSSNHQIENNSSLESNTIKNNSINFINIFLFLLFL